MYRRIFSIEWRTVSVLPDAAARPAAAPGVPLHAHSLTLKNKKVAVAMFWIRIQ